MTPPTSALCQQFYPGVGDLASPEVELAEGSGETLHLLEAELVPHGGGEVVFVLVHVLAKDQETTWKKTTFFVFFFFFYRAFI